MRKAWLLIGLSAATLLSVARAQDDAWLAVINGDQVEQQQRPIIPQQPLQPVRPRQPVPAPQTVGNRRRENDPGVQNTLIQEASPPLRQQQPVRPIRPRPRPLPGRRPHPTVKEEGGIINGITRTITGAVDDVSCAAQGLYAEGKLQDPAYINYQLQCLLDRGECDATGNLVKRMAPDIIRGGCPPPCDKCKKEQIQKVMATLSQKYPKQFQIMLQKFGNKRF
jgi:hypothetical protein